MKRAFESVGMVLLGVYMAPVMIGILLLALALHFTGIQIPDRHKEWLPGSLILVYFIVTLAFLFRFVVLRATQGA